VWLLLPEPCWHYCDWATLHATANEIHTYAHKHALVGWTYRSTFSQSTDSWNKYPQNIINNGPLNIYKTRLDGFTTSLSGSVAERIACWTQVQKGLGSKRSRDRLFSFGQVQSAKDDKYHKQATKIVFGSKTVTRQHCGCDLNPGPTAPESSTLTTRLPRQMWQS